LSLESLEKFMVIIERFEKEPDFFLRCGVAIREAINWAIDRTRTGRRYIHQLEKTEKTAIGTKVEILLKKLFPLAGAQFLIVK